MSVQREIFRGKDCILVPTELWEEVKNELRNHWFFYDGEGESHNNDEVIELSGRIEAWENEA